MKRRLISAAVMLTLCFIYAGVAKADNLHLCDINAVCNSGNVITISSSATVAFANGTSYAGGTLYLLVLTPAAGTTGAWKAKGLAFGTVRRQFRCRAVSRLALCSWLTCWMLAVIWWQFLRGVRAWSLVAVALTALLNLRASLCSGLDCWRWPWLPESL